MRFYEREGLLQAVRLGRLSTQDAYLWYNHALEVSMSSAAVAVLRQNLVQLDPNDFEVACRSYMHDRGYNAQLGKSPGADGSIDLYGQNGAGDKFVGHCTTMTPKERGHNIRRKFVKDVTNSLDDSLRMDVSEVWLFSRERFLDPVDEEDFKLQIVDLFSRRGSTRLLRIFICSGDQLIRETARSFPQGVTYRILSARSRRELIDPESYQTEEGRVGRGGIEFLSLLGRYHAALPQSLKEELLSQILNGAWFELGDPFNAVRAREMAMDEILGTILAPTIASALGERGNAKTITYAAEALLQIRTEFDGIKKDCNVALSRILRSALYDETSIETELLQQCIEESDPFWRSFCCDIYLRAVCGYLSIAARSLMLIEDHANRHREIRSGGALDQVWLAITSPEAFSRQPLRVAVERIRAAASICADAIDAKWIVTALDRILPLYDSSDDDTEWSEFSLDVCNALPRKLLERSSYLLYWRLRVFLNSFMYRKDPLRLRKFEDEFLKSLPYLFPLQRQHLQLEYACAVNMAAQVLSSSEFEQLRFAETLYRPDTLEETARLRNPIIGRVKVFRPTSPEQRGTIVVWLASYGKSLVRTYLLPQVDSDPQRLLRLRSATNLLPLRPGIHARTRASLYRRRAETSDPNYWAKSTALFSLMGVRDDRELWLFCARQALEASEYIVARNAKHIGRILFNLYYYGEATWRSEVTELAHRLALRTGIGTSAPRLHWAYHAGMFVIDLGGEMKFLHDLWQSVQTAATLAGLGSSRYSRGGAVIPDEVHDTTKNHRQDSLFAATLGSDLANPVIWNICGTALNNIRETGDLDVLAMASSFYNIARWLSVSSRNLDPKYTFNFIRIQSELYMKQDRLDADFLVAVAQFLRQPAAKHFNYNIESTQPYVSLVQCLWARLPTDVRQELARSLQVVDWLPRETLQFLLQPP